MSGGREALSTRPSFASAKRMPTRGPLVWCDCLGQSHLPSMGARTGRARQDCVRTGQWHGLWRSNGGGASGRGRPVGAMACERRSASRFAFLGPFHRRRPLCSASALGKAICLPWVRAQGAHGKTACARANGVACGDPMASGLRGGDADWQCHCSSFGARPVRAPKERRCHCPRLGAAHPWNAIGPPKKFSKTPLRVVREFGILAPSADEPGSRKGRDLFVFLGG